MPSPVVQPGGIFAPAPDLREVLGKRGVNWVAGQVGNLRRLATAGCAGKTTGAQFAKLPHNRVPLPGWSVHDLHATLLYLRDVDHQRVCGDAVRPVLLLLTVGVAHVAVLAGRVTV